MRTIAAAAVAWYVLAALTTPGAQPAQPVVPVVTIDVTVLGRDGRPVPGLTAADFEIKLDDRVAPIRELTYVPATAAMAGAVGPLFDAVTPAVSATYRLTIEPPPTTRPGAEFSLSAIVRRPGVKVSADRRAVALAASSPAPPKAPVPIDEQRKAGIATGRAAQGVPRLRSIGPFLASDLRRFTADSQAQPRPLTGDELPGGTTALTAVLELRPAAGAVSPPDVLVKIDLLAAGDQTPLIERVVTPEPGAGMLVAEAEFPVERLPAGAYSLRATVLSGAAVLGTTSATFTKR
jgi:hypothetical protein